MDEKTQKIVHVILQASRNQPGNQSELLKLVTHLPTITEQLLPYPIDLKTADVQENEEVSELFKTMSKGLTDLLKQAVHIDDDTDQDAKAQRICELLENLMLLGGCDFAKKKLMDVLSHETYSLIQEGMDFVENFSENLETVERNIIYSASRVKTLALTTIQALFLCEQMKLSHRDQMSIVSSILLEKLSTELLMVVDSMKESLQTGTSSNRNAQSGYFLTQPEESSADSFFTTASLVSLANMINCFLNLEKSLKEYHLSMLQKTHTKSERMKKSALKQRSKLPDILRSSQEASWIRSVNIYGDWDWQEVLKDIGPVITKSISKAFDDCHARELNIARKPMNGEETNPDETAESLSSSILSGPRIPRKSLQYFKGALQLIKYSLPYAVLGRSYRPLCGLASTYIDECNQMLKTMKSFLSAALNDFPEKITTLSLCSILGTCEDVCAVLGHCAFKIDSEPRMAFQGTLQSYNDMIKTIKNMIVQNLSGRFRGCILHDADGDHFHDPKEFGDGESCSHSITNWKEFLDRLRHDLNNCVSDSAGNEIFSRVFSSSLQVLETRYLRCEPSYNRKKQLLLDIPMILSICQKYTSNDESSVPLPELHGGDMSQIIHGCCCNLQAVLCFVAGPLDIVEKSTSEFRKKDWSPIPTDTRSNSANISCSPGEGSEALAHCLHSLLRDKFSLLDRILSPEFMRKFDEKKKRDFQDDIYTILAKCSFLKSNAFFHCAFNSVGKNAQKFLDNILPSSNEVFTHHWQKIVFDQLGIILCQSLTPAVTFLCHPTWSSLGLNVIETEEMLKGVLNLSHTNRTTNRDGHITASVILLIQGLAQALYLLPEWLITLFILIQSKLANVTHVICGSVPLHVLISASRRFLDDPSLWDQFCSVEFTKEGVEAMKHVNKIFCSICHKNFKHMDGLDNMKLHLMNLCEEVEGYIGTMQDSGFEYSDEQLFLDCKRKVANFLMDNDKVLDCLSRVKDVVSSICHPNPATSVEQHHYTPNDLRSNLNHDWEKMCREALTTLDWEGVKLLISHRWEMKEGASLNSKEAEIVEKMKSKLDLI